MKTIITGCNGQLGHELLRSVPPQMTIEAVDIDILDITDQSAVKDFVNAARPQLIINAAAYTAVDKAEDDRETAYAVNAQAVKFLAEAALQNKARVIHISTDYVFDGLASQPYQPDDATAPASVYGQTKLAGEQLLQELLPQQSVIIRTAWLYSIHGNNFLKTILKLLRERDSIGIIADQFGTPTAAATLADTVWRFAAIPQIYGIFHWTDGDSASWYDFAREIRRIGIDIGLLDSTAAEIRPITTADYPLPAPRPSYSVMDKSSTYQTLGIASAPWPEALRQVMLELQTVEQ